MIVNAVYSILFEQRRGNVAVQILVRELRRFRCQFLAYVHAEGDEHDSGRVVEAMLLQLLQGDVHELVLTLFAVLRLELEHQYSSAAAFSLGQILVEGRHSLAVRELILFQEPVGVLLDVLPLDMRIVMHHDDIISSKMNVEFAAPQVIFLGRAERSDGILRMGSLVAVPESAVRAYPDAAGALCQCRSG